MMKTDFRVIIPARYASTRLPGKVLMDIHGKTMLQHVYERALESGAESVVIATGDAEIAKAAEKFRAPVCLTSPSHPTGTDRLAEAARLLNYAADEIIVNLQGDEPLVPPEIIQQVARNLDIREEVSMATLCERIHDITRLQNPNVVKVVMNAEGQALYFSRSVIPWLAAGDDEINLPQQGYYAHIGLYAYRVEFLQEYVSLARSPLEEIESLEQLRALWHGHKIHVDIALKNPAQDVNTAEDLARVREIMAL